MSGAYSEGDKGGCGVHEEALGGQLAQPSHEQVAQVSADQVPSAFPPEPAHEHVAQVSADQVPSAFPPEPANVYETQVSADQVPPAFPPEPPAVLESCDMGGSLSSGSFSRVSAAPFMFPTHEFTLPAPEFPEDWDDTGDGINHSPDLQSQASQDGVLFQGDLSSPGPSWGSPIFDASLARECVRAEGSAESVTVDPSPGPSKQIDLTSHQAPVDDAVGSFVGSIVKGDVARFGSFFNGHKLPWENDFAKRLLDPEFEWDPLLGFKQDPVIPPLSATARAEGSLRPSAKEASPGSIFRLGDFLGGAAEQQLVHLRKLRQAKDLTVAQVPITLYWFFEVSQHKGARKVQLKTRLLPILVPMIGVHGKCWVDEAVKAFRDAGGSGPFGTEDHRIFLEGDLLRTTQAIYSRELCAAPARRLQDMIREIAEGGSSAAVEGSGKPAEVKVGLSRETLRAFADHGIDTLSKLAYSCGQPGSPLPQTEFDDFVANLIPSALLGEKGSVKRLLFESQALLLNDLREQVTQPDKWSTKDVPTVERQKRMEAVKASIPGVVVEGPLEPSHGLLNAACRMEREGQPRYIAPEQCGTRMYEIQNVKAQSKVLSLEEGKLAISEEKGLPEVACGSALLLQEALKRRGVALQFAGVASFLAHEKYIQKLFAHMGREPPPGHARTSVHQLLTADKHVWTKMIEDEVSAKRGPDGRYPVDDALLPALQSYDVTVCLLPREAARENKKRPPPKKFAQDRAIRKLGGHAQTPDKKRICFSRAPSTTTDDSVGTAAEVADILSLISLLESETPSRGPGTHVVQDELGYNLTGQIIDFLRVGSWEMAWGIPWDTLDALENMDDAEVTALRAKELKLKLCAKTIFEDENRP
ncbi:hypothetical protein AK812_SmicGene37550 [Symbiodinium microadriaticum]|uniref:Uncharacterized protein n=1 Tax=Symbiodinium microadriaticum TaxID=2951 RepID=A0A1Q9CFZ0_SYMMI|nr:hypothetical protein AK812_SmicGene37550 [Symbiodinium microadriaticum]